MSNFKHIQGRNHEYYIIAEISCILTSCSCMYMYIDLPHYTLQMQMSHCSFDSSSYPATTKVLQYVMFTGIYGCPNNYIETNSVCAFVFAHHVTLTTGGYKAMVVTTFT